MNTLDAVTRARLRKIDSSKDITPADLLRMALDDIERGETVADGLLIVWCNRPKDGEWTAGTYRSNLSRDQELVQLRLAERRLMRGWFGGDDQ